MKIIQVVKEKKTPNIFEINGYSFTEIESEILPLPIYQIITKQHFATQLDVRYWLEELIPEMEFLLGMPSELTGYIKDCEENIRFKETYLFHDLRTKYIDFIVLDRHYQKNNIILVGFTLLEDETCFAFKAFNLLNLSEFVQNFLKSCKNRQIDVEIKKNLKWIQLEQSMLPDTNLNRNDIFESFLNKTLQGEFSDIFIKAFHIIDTKGYLDKQFFIDFSGQNSL